MYEKEKLTQLNDYFLEKSKRGSEAVYFYRITGYSAQIKEFIEKYYNVTRLTGVFIEGRIPNPDENNLRYFNEILNRPFSLEKGFILSELSKWLPRLTPTQKDSLGEAVFAELYTMRAEGKTDSILKNAYVKFMCWLYYKFERILNRLGENDIPKILYEGNVSDYELRMLAVLSSCGCDIVLLQYNGDEQYLKVDAKEKKSVLFIQQGQTAFPADFSIKNMQKEKDEKERIARIYGGEPAFLNCTNAWISGNPFDDVLKEVGSRGNDEHFYYNCFIKVSGVEDKITYIKDLLEFSIKLKKTGRKTVIEDEKIMPPQLDEIGKVKRKTYTSYEQLLEDISVNIIYSANKTLQQIMRKSFIDILMEESTKADSNINRLTNKAVYLICWLNRYKDKLFEKWQYPQISIFLFLGVCENENQVLFFRFLSKLPVDLLILSPNLNSQGMLSDSFLFEKKWEESMQVDKFPKDDSDIRIGTAAYHAEQDLNSIMYQGTGLYRNQQYEDATTISLQTMYEEIAILWEQEGKYRPNFDVIDETVTLPVIFAKVSGVKDGNCGEYWRDIKKLLVKDSYLITKTPFIESTAANPMKQHVSLFLKNGKLQKQKILAHPDYQYGYLREDMQEYILKKIQLLIDKKRIKGTFSTGVEYTIVSTLLNLNKEIIRLLQKFDFTKNIPKLVCIDVSEKVYSLEDSIMIAFLNLVGFDIVIFTPTGYQNIEKYFNVETIEEHRIGEFIYDLRVPDFGVVASENKRQSWHDKIFKRGC